MEIYKKYRDKKLVTQIADAIRELTPNRRVKFVHICGSHEQTITRFGIRSLLPNNLEIFSGPGCPVCCTPATEIDESIELAERGCIVTTFGDMFCVPGTKKSLSDAKTNAADVRIVYGISDAVKAARDNPKREVVHVAIGFETTAPTTAAEVLRGLPENFSLLVCHRLMPPVMQFLLASGEIALDGFICPGHVSTIIGSKPYEPLSRRYKVPQVIAGFEPVDVLIAIWMLLKQLREGRSEVGIEYTRSVRPEGNVQAQRMMREAFESVDKRWRGFPVIPKSALELRPEFERHDARKRFAIDFSRETSADFVKGCRCGEVLRGLIYPQECPMFDKACTPEHPLGPCAVTAEGACNAAMKPKFDPVLRFKKKGD